MKLKKSDTIQNILENEGVEVNFLDCTTEEQQLYKCLLLVSKQLKVKKEATNLVSMLEDLKLAEGRREEEVVRVAMDEDTIIRLATNVKELTEVEVFSIQGANKQVVCVHCGTFFRIEPDF